MRLVVHTENAQNDGETGDGTHVLACVERCYRDMLAHDGFGEMRIEVRILKRGQKEVIVHFGKQFRFVVDTP